MKNTPKPKKKEVEEGKEETSEDTEIEKLMLQRAQMNKSLNKLLQEIKKNSNKKI